MQKINRLLLEKWDPIGVQHTAGAETEYDQYAFQIYEIICHSVSSNRLFDFLWNLETEHMGLKGNKIKTKNFAELLFHEIKQEL